MVPARGRRWGWGVPGSPSSSRDSWSPFRAGGQQRGQNPSHADTPANPQSSFPHLWLTQVTEGEVQVLDENVDGAFGDPDDFLVPWTGELRCHWFGLALYLSAHPTPHAWSLMTAVNQYCAKRLQRRPLCLWLCEVDASLYPLYR